MLMDQETAMPDKSPKIDFATLRARLPKEIGDDVVRLINAAGEWRLTYLSEESTKVSYSWNGELLGDFPSFYLTTAWETGGKEIIGELKQAIKDLKTIND